jgi:hypothetical protein
MSTQSKAMITTEAIAMVRRTGVVHRCPETPSLPFPDTFPVNVVSEESMLSRHGQALAVVTGAQSKNAGSGFLHPGFRSREGRRSVAPADSQHVRVNNTRVQRDGGKPVAQLF